MSRLDAVRRFWHYERPREPRIARYRRLRRDFGRPYALVLAIGFDGVGT